VVQFTGPTATFPLLTFEPGPLSFPLQGAAQGGLSLGLHQDDRDPGQARDVERVRVPVRREMGQPRGEQYGGDGGREREPRPSAVPRLQRGGGEQRGDGRAGGADLHMRVAVVDLFPGGGDDQRNAADRRERPLRPAQPSADVPPPLMTPGPGRNRDRRRRRRRGGHGVNNPWARAYADNSARVSNPSFVRRLDRCASTVRRL